MENRGHQRIVHDSNNSTPDSTDWNNSDSPTSANGLWDRRSSHRISFSMQNFLPEGRSVSQQPICSQCHMSTPVSPERPAQGQSHMDPRQFTDCACYDGILTDTSMPLMHECTGYGCSHCQYHEEFHQPPLARPTHFVRRQSSLTRHSLKNGPFSSSAVGDDVFSDERRQSMILLPAADIITSTTSTADSMAGSFDPQSSPLSSKPLPKAAQPAQTLPQLPNPIQPLETSTIPEANDNNLLKKIPRPDTSKPIY